MKSLKIKIIVCALLIGLIAPSLSFAWRGHGPHGYYGPRFAYGYYGPGYYHGPRFVYGPWGYYGPHMRFYTPHVRVVLY